MPTYEYACKSCEHQFEIFQSFSDDSLTTCPKCTGALKKIFGNVGITFKGSGFYKNDSRPSSTKSGGSSSTDSSSGTGSGSAAAASSDSSSSSGTGSAGSGSSDAGSGSSSNGSAHSHGHSHGAGTHSH